MSSTTSSELTPSPPRSPSPAPAAAELTAYAPLFRRRKPPVSEPPVPCLHCAIKDMHCVYYRGDTRCQRCERSVEERVCIFQRQDLTRPETRLTEQQLEQLAEEERQAADARGPRHAWLMAHLVPQDQQAEEEDQGPELQCMVYSRDPELSGDRKRLLALAADILQAAEDRGTTYVHGQPVLAGDARNFVLPNWQEAQSWREKRDSSPEYRKRAAFFEGLTAEQAAATARTQRSGRERRMAREGSADKKRSEREAKEEEKGKAVAEQHEGQHQDEY